MEIDGGVAVVTGAAAGTGRAVAARLAADGAFVVVGDVEGAGGRATVAAIEARGGRAAFVRADMTRDADVAALIERAGAGLRVLVNNAGGGGHVPPHFPDATPAQWSATLALNLRGAMLATQLALAPMRAAGAGAVVNIASSSGFGGGAYQSPEYGAAKAGLIRFSTALADLRERMGVRVNCVVPDWILTERAQAELAALSAAERAAAPVPLPMEEVAGAVLRFVRDDDLAGRVCVLRGGEPPRLLDPAALEP